MNKIFIIILSFCLLLSCMGCSSDYITTSAPTSEMATESPTSTPETSTPDISMEETQCSTPAQENTQASTVQESLVAIPDTWTNLLEKHYEEVKKQFEEAGFTNITCIAHEIDFNESKVFEGSVVNIAIGDNGEACTFEKGEKWPLDVKIRIDYRTKPVERQPSETSSASNPFNKVDDYNVRISTEYSHIDSDVLRLGNNESAWITIDATPATLTANDFIIDYDDTMIEIIEIKSSISGSTSRFELTVKAKRSGTSEIIIAAGYDLYTDADNASCVAISVKGLTSSEGRVVYVTSTGEKYHFSASCINSGIKTTLSDALAYEYAPCSKCAN